MASLHVTRGAIRQALGRAAGDGLLPSRQREQTLLGLHLVHYSTSILFVVRLRPAPCCGRGALMPHYLIFLWSELSFFRKRFSLLLLHLCCSLAENL